MNDFLLGFYDVNVLVQLSNDEDELSFCDCHATMNFEFYHLNEYFEIPHYYYYYHLMYLMYNVVYQGPFLLMMIFYRRNNLFDIYLFGFQFSLPFVELRRLFNIELLSINNNQYEGSLEIVKFVILHHGLTLVRRLNVFNFDII